MNRRRIRGKGIFAAVLLHCVSLLAWLLMLAFALPLAQALAPGDSPTNGGHILREFYDPILGSRWQLIVDPAHPGRPGRLILVGTEAVLSGTATQAANRPDAASVPYPSRQVLPLVIHAGDHVTVDQETAALHARLLAVTLESAGAGQPVRLRLSLGADSQQGLPGTVILGTAVGLREARWVTAAPVTDPGANVVRP